MFFVSRGIDYEFEIHLNGKKIHYQEGMFTPVELALDKHLQEVSGKKDMDSEYQLLYTP
ncbi:MAG: hypothetical protein V5A47_13700 [Bacteroidales bacterium]|nr:hypothetical protein [Bacteroidales bacterium]MBS3776818.1 hypothetical protein [Bacteroidales bacterium]